MTAMLSFEGWLKANPDMRDAEEPCFACEGRGYWTAENENSGQTANIECDECDGTGLIPAAFEKYLQLRNKELQLLTQWQR